VTTGPVLTPEWFVDRWSRAFGTGRDIETVAVMQPNFFSVLAPSEAGAHEVASLIHPAPPPHTARPEAPPLHVDVIDPRTIPIDLPEDEPNQVS
jgi:hypothetical protein